MNDNNDKKDIINNNIIINNNSTQKQKEKDIIKKEKIPDEDIIIEYVLKINGDVEIFKYFKNKILGSGGFGKVYEVTCEWSKEKYACKVIPIKIKNKKLSIDDINREISIQKYLNHPNILKYIHRFDDSNNIYILSELCKNQSLKQLRKKRGVLTELEIQYYAIQIISAMKYLNDKNILHRDLKLSNIFITDDMQIKIGDFGLAIKLNDPYEKFEAICGTRYYIAPEMINNIGIKSQSDIWSFGVVLYVLCTDHYPFPTRDYKKILRSAERKYYRKPFKFRKVSTEFCDLINKIFEYDQRERLTWTEILNHDFFKLGKSIPKFLPITTLESPPSIKFIKDYMPQADETGYIKTNKKFNFDNEIKFQYRLNFEKRRNIDRENKIYIEENKNYIDQDEAFYYKNHVLNQKFINNEEENKGLKSPQIFIKEYKNENCSFGLAYLLSSGTYGINFINKNILLADEDFKHFFYLEQKGKEYITHHFKKYDKVDDKKEIDFMLLEIYKEYFDKITKKKVTPLEGLFADEFEEEQNKILLNKEVNPPIHVKFFICLNQVDVFLLTNGTFQAIFNDGTEIILSSEIPTVTYVDKEKKRWVYKSDKVFTNNRNEEMKKKLKYVKSII